MQVDANQKHKAQGIITVVQEQRFRLITDAGQGLLLTLAHDASVDNNGLKHLHETLAHVDVEYEGEPNLQTGVAHSIRLLN